MGLGFDAVILSLHPNYSSLDRFRTFMRQNMFERVNEIETFMVNLDEEQNSLPFSFSLLASHLLSPMYGEDKKSN
jgi:hypothetical protein